jgi:DNA polymerase-3 subunit delta
MPEYQHNDFEKMIDSLSSEQITPVYLIHGDEFLVKNIVNRLKTKLLPETKQKTNFNPIDGANDNIPSAIEQLNTFSLMPGTRIIAILDSQIFYAAQDRHSLLEKGKTAFLDNQLKKASRYFLTLLSSEKFGIDAIHPQQLNETIESLIKKGKSEDFEHIQWMKAVAEYCISQNISVPDAINYSDLLTESIEKGFAQRNILIITTDSVQKNRRLYKSILKKGTVIHCQVPKGFIKADKDKQEKTFREKAELILSQHGKTINPDAFRLMLNMIEPSVRSLTLNLEKLIQYVGDRKKISKDDVESAIERSRQDPIFELTNAISDRNIIDALTVLDNLFANQFNPLQALAAIANLIRKLLLVDDVKERYHYQKGMSFALFKNQFFKNVLEYDQSIASHMQAEENSTDSDKKKTKRKTSKSTLMIAKNPKSIYPVYLSFKASENYQRQELVNAVHVLYQADKRIKTSGQDNRRVIEQTIIEICRRKPPVKS